MNTNTIYAAIIFVSVSIFSGCASNPRIFNMPEEEKIVDHFEAQEFHEIISIYKTVEKTPQKKGYLKIPELCSTLFYVRKYADFMECSKQVYLPNSLKDIMLAKIHLEYGDYDKSIQYANAVIRWEEHAIDGLSKLQNPDMDDIVNVMNKLINLRHAYGSLAVAHSLRHDVTEAIKALKSIDAIQDDSSTHKKIANYYKALVLLNIGDYKGSLHIADEYTGFSIDDRIITPALTGFWQGAKIGIKNPSTKNYNPSYSTERNVFGGFLVGAITGAITGAIITPIILNSTAYDLFSDAEEDVLYMNFMKARALYLNQQYQESREVYDELLDEKNIVNHPDIHYIILHDLGNIYKRDRVNNREILNKFKEAIRIIESIRTSINTEASKIGFAGDKQSVYMDIVGLLVEMGDYAGALEYAEKGKSRALVDLLAQRFDPATSKICDAKCNNLIQNIKSIEDELLVQTRLNQVTETREKTRSLHNIRQVASSQLENQYPEIFSLVSAGTLSAREIQNMLSDEEVILEYYGNDERLFVFVVSSQKIVAVKVNEPSLSSHIQDFRNQIAARKDGYQATAKLIYDKIVRPVSSYLNTDNIILIPDGSLHHLPFGALMEHDKYFIEKYSIRFSPSASAIKYIRSQRHKLEAPKMLVIGNPTKDLPQAEKEAKLIQAMYKKATTLLVTEQATETKFKQESSKYDVIHLAAHGLFDVGNPMGSSVKFASDAINDGKLTANEVYGLKLNANLVTLSACQTGLVNIGNGDEIIGLTRGFLFAGTQNLIITLWNISDKKTLYLMNKFYTDLPNRGIHQALRKAQLETLKRFKHPYYWSAFHLIGYGSNSWDPSRGNKKEPSSIIDQVVLKGELPNAGNSLDPSRGNKKEPASIINQVVLKGKLPNAGIMYASKHPTKLQQLYAVKRLNPTASNMTSTEFAKASTIYFERCVGCHGVLRKGATGPNLTPKKTTKKSIAQLARIIYKGTATGMPAWGADGFLTQYETKLMARYVQEEPPQPPQWNMEKMYETWKIHVPVKDRPVVAPNTNWHNYFGAVLRDVGKIAIIDGDNKKVKTIISTGFATHILRVSASGRYIYVIGRDSKVSAIDVWASPPNLVAEIRTGIDARSIEASKYNGYEDKYVAVGEYWPPQYVILRGNTLEPLKIMQTKGYTYDIHKYHTEPRVASSGASRISPMWILGIKESGKVILADYGKLESGIIQETTINAERFLHGGGWDSTGRYFLAAANARDTISVIDTVERRLVKNIITGTKPHPGRGANWVDPKYGRVWGTGHLGEGLISIISTDPAKKYAWSVVRKWKLDGSALFIKTHPKSNHVYHDNTINRRKSNVLTVFNKDRPGAAPKEIIFKKKVVHIEYDKSGSEVWISLWDKNGEIVILDDKTLGEIKRIKGLYTPTGKFNVYNTMKDIY